MFEKLKKALKVAKDLDTLEFTFDSTRKSDFHNTPYKLHHPHDNYCIWTASGFWFTSLYEVGGKDVLYNHKVSKFGAIGKCIVWWKCQRHITKWRDEYNGACDSRNQDLINKVMEK